MVVKAKKVFTYKMSVGLLLTWVAGTQTDDDAIMSFVAEEDMHIIGFELMAFPDKLNQNDAHGRWQATLSQNSDLADPRGILGRVNCGDGWNTAPASVWRTEAHIVVMFPEGYAVELKEEGNLYLTLNGSYCQGAGEPSGWGVAVIYYTK